MKKEKISVIIPVFNEERFIKDLLWTINKQSYPLDKIEVIIIDGGSEDSTISLIEDISKELNYKLIILHNEKKIPVSALNIGLKYAQGEIIVRLDAHSNYESQYIEKVVYQLTNSKEYCNVGGVAKAVGYDKISNAIAAVLNSPIGVGGAKFRYAQEPIETDTLFPGAWWKKDLVKIKGWNEEWIVNEDMELNVRLKKETEKKIVIIPDIKLEYYPRNSFGKLLRQYYRYGYWRNKTSNKHAESMRLSHIIPPFFVITLIALPLLRLNSLFVGLSLFYLLTIVFFEIKIKEKNNSLSHIIISIMITQVAWGIGDIHGYMKFGIPFKGFWKVFKTVFLSKVRFNKIS
ncbi:glycosyltransferase family 2 protein (plasmid) [Bacillus megaterium]|nr:glycosyltransferase family 2 protein [Priestia megaterium]